MKKNTFLPTIMIATTLCFTGISFANPCPLKDNVPPEPPAPQEFAMPRFDLGQQILANPALNLTEKQKDKILKSEKKTRKQIQRYEDKIAKAKFKKHSAVRKHLDTINATLTPEQKQILQNQHERRMHEFIEKYKHQQEMNKLHKEQKPCCEQKKAQNGHCCKAGKNPQPCTKKPCTQQPIKKK